MMKMSSKVDTRQMNLDLESPEKKGMQTLSQLEFVVQNEPQGKECLDYRQD